MTATSLYKVGASILTAVPLSTYWTYDRDRDPKSSPIYSSDIDLLGDGTGRAQGWLIQDWEWGFLSEGYWESLKALAGPQVIYTRKNDSTFAWFSAILMPPKEPEHEAGRVLKARLEWHGLVEIEESA